MLYGVTASPVVAADAVAGPRVLSVTKSGGNADVTGHPVDYPAEVEEGDLLLLAFIANKASFIAPVITPSVEWETLHVSGGTDAAYYFAWREADGTEGGTSFGVTTVGGGYHDAMVVRIGVGTWDNARTPEFAGLGSFGFLPELAPPWGLADNLWVAMGLWQGAVVVDEFPMPDNQQTHDSGAGAGQCSTSLCTDTLLSSERPIPPAESESWGVSAGTNDRTGLIAVAPPGLEFLVTWDEFEPYILNSGEYFSTAAAHVWRGTAPYAFEILTGALPDGFELNAETGEIFGVATEGGTFPVTVRCTDDDAQTFDAELSLFVQVLPLEVMSGIVQTEWGLGSDYYDLPYVKYGRTPFVFSLQSGALPDGTTLDAETGAVSGLLTAEGDFEFTIRCTDADLNFVDMAAELAVEYFPLEIYSDYYDALVDEDYNASSPFQYGRPPYVFTIEDGALPPGLALDPDTGSITGTPTTPGTYTFTVRCTDDDANFIDLVDDTIEITEP